MKGGVETTFQKLIALDIVQDRALVMVISTVLPDYLGWCGQYAGPTNACPTRRRCIILTSGRIVVVREASG